MMMKWGGRKASSASSSSSSSSPSVPSNHHASPFSWFSKFKHMKINSSSATTHHANNKKQKPPKNKNTSSTGTTVSPPRYSCGNNNNGGDYASSSSLWRSSFSEQFQFHDEDNVIESSGFPAGAKKNASREGTLINNNIKLEEKKEERKFVDDRKVKMEMQEDTKYENLRRRFEKKAQKVLQEQLLKLERERESRKLIQEEKKELESPRPICTPRVQHYSFPSSSESKSSNSLIRTSNNKKNIVEKKKLMMNPTEELLNLNLKVKTKKKKQQTVVVDGSSSREIIHQRRKSKHSPRIRIHSPRMSSPKVDQVCRIKAIEDMKKARLKMKKEREEIVLQETPLLTKVSSSEDRFAVIKCSLDPRQDFRDSMIEMIIEKRIRNPEEMEELLACYLTLNADEYHDLIIQVFRQVWFQLSHAD